MAHSPIAALLPWLNRQRQTPAGPLPSPSFRAAQPFPTDFLRDRSESFDTPDRVISHTRSANLPINRVKSLNQPNAKLPHLIELPTK